MLSLPSSLKIKSTFIDLIFPTVLGSIFKSFANLSKLISNLITGTVAVAIS